MAKQVMFFWIAASRICSIHHAAFFCGSRLVFFAVCFVCIHVVHPYISMDTAMAWTKPSFSLSDTLKFRMIDNLFVVSHAFSRRMLT